MADIVIGTAGHIDHGKTTLIKSLTGIETDTTKEEKKRGMSINLGFAYLDLPNKQRVGIVDVPGHEKFIRNMVAGLPGIDLILLVIDAAEGIMPQTKEHIDILTLLGIKNFMIVLTKCQTVDEDLKELVKEDIKEQLAHTPLKEATIYETDAVDNIGLDELKDAIQSFSMTISKKKIQKVGRLNVDRVFSVKGFGTVVTGTLIDGEFKVGQELTVFPSGKKTKIRSIQVHEEEKKSAFSGQRTALNLTNIATEDISRGDVLTNGESLESTWMIDGKISCLPHTKLGINLWDRVRVLIGTQEVFARIVPIGTERIEAGSEGFVQLRLEEQLAVKTGDHFIIRAYSPMITIGGGQVLDAIPKKHRRFKQDVIDSLKIKEEGSIDQLILDFLLNQQTMIGQLKDISDYLITSQEELLLKLDELAQVNDIIKLSDNEYLHPVKLERFKEDVYEVLNCYHKAYRLRAGMPIEELRSKLKINLTPKQMDKLINKLVENKAVNCSNHCLGHPDFEVKLNPYQLKTKEEMENKLRKTGFTPLKKEELIAIDEKNGADVLESLEDETVVFLTFEYIISKTSYEKAVSLVEEFIRKEKVMTLADFRDMTNSSRKSSMLILEYLDENQITKRIDNTRVLVER